MKQKSLFLSLVLITLATFSVSAEERVAEVKLNVLGAAATVFNPSLELGVGKQQAVTADYIASFAEENFLNSGAPFLTSVFMCGYRYYFKEGANSGFFGSADVGLMFYRMSKDAIPLIHQDHGDGVYDVGYGYLLGCTLGYKYNISKRFTAEASISGGYQNSRHELYTPDGVRDYDFNTTAEWSLFKAAINLGYKIWK